MYSEKYDTDTPERIITNDMYLAAYLLCEGCELDHVECNGRRRVSFVLAGQRVSALRDAYRRGPVHVHVRSFRDNLIHVRRLMDDKQRSATCPRSPIALSRV